MSDEVIPEVENPTATALAEPPAEENLQQAVEITDVGPCKKHIKVTIDRTAIDGRFDEKYTELVRSESPQVNGFRPGKAPRKVIERRYKTAVEEQVRQEVLMASLEQLATENKITPLSPPDLDPSKLEIPDSGPFTYEFDVEVRPDFDLPNYKGLTLKRPVKTFTQAEIEKEQRKLLEPAGTLVAKEGANVKIEMDDYIVADVKILDGATEMNDIKDVRVKVEKQLALSDGVADEFGKKLVGAKVGDERDVPIKLATGIANAALQGKEINAKFKINEIKSVRLPELSKELLSEFGVRNEDQFQELIGATLERRLQYQQRQVLRQQVMEQMAAAAKLELPNDLLVRQANRTLQRRVMEMRSAGMTDEQIVGRQRILQQDAIATTAASLREHFVLQKIAELEKIEITEADLDLEIDRIASRTDENPRKVRARMEKEDLIEALATELLERRALDLVLDNATYEDVQLKSEDEEGEVATMAAEAVPGSTQTPSPTQY